MKASEVIERLKELIDEHGDLEVGFYDWGGAEEIFEIEFKTSDEFQDVDYSLGKRFFRIT